MIECVFTLDYEIYGDGRGGLGHLVYEPAERLTRLFLDRGLRFVNFVEVAELERIEEVGSDPAIELVKRQLCGHLGDGFEIGLHLHPQWYNAVYEDGKWVLDFSEYNLCTLPPPRVAQIVERSLDYLRHVTGVASFTPLSFRAGNWLFQPTQPAARILSQQGLRVDSSVFKGGLQRHVGLDYRRSRKNGYCWTFDSDVNERDSRGSLIEVPVYTAMVPFWRMLTKKRAAFRNTLGPKAQRSTGRLHRLGDFLRFRYPLKLDFCRMTLRELTWVMDRIVAEDRRDPDTLRPVVAIGHTKDLVDFDTVEHFLSYLAANAIVVSTFAEMYPRLCRRLEAMRRHPAVAPTHDRDPGAASG